jgi:Peptidase A4 family
MQTKLVSFAAAAFAIPSFLTGFHGGSQGILTSFEQTQNSGATAVNSSASADSSLNWAGYEATGGTFTSVGASWTVPDSTAPAGTSSGNTLSADATWVGVGGVSSKDLIQAGTQAIIQDGTTTYQAWYEVLPDSSQQVALTIRPGDAVTVSVAQQSTEEWEVSFKDNTTGQSYATEVAYQSSLSSAEWIEEMPSDDRGFVALDNFGTAAFTNGFAVENGNQETISGASAQPLTMINNADQSLATVSSLDADGASFTVTRTSVASSPTAVGYASGRGSSGRWTRTSVGIQGYTPSPSQKIYRGGGSGSPTVSESAGGGITVTISGNGFSLGNLPFVFRNFQNNFRFGWNR